MCRVRPAQPSPVNVPPCQAGGQHDQQPPGAQAPQAQPAARGRPCPVDVPPHADTPQAPPLSLARHALPHPLLHAYTVYPTDHSIDILCRQLLKLTAREHPLERRKPRPVWLLTRDSIYNHVRDRLVHNGVPVTHERTANAIALVFPPLHIVLGDCVPVSHVSMQTLVDKTAGLTAFFYMPIELVCTGMLWNLPRDATFVYSGSVNGLVAAHTRASIYENIEALPRRFAWVGFNVPDRIPRTCIDYTWARAGASDEFMHARYRTLSPQLFTEFNV